MKRRVKEDKKEFDGKYIKMLYYVERLNENVDVIKYEAETGEYTLNINNSAEIMRAYEEELSIEADDFYIDATDFGENQAETYKIIGDSDTRTRVTNVTSSPYYAIAFLLVTNQNGTITSGTGFMINDSCMATAAHVVDGAQKVEVYFQGIRRYLILMGYVAMKDICIKILLLYIVIQMKC